MANENIVSIITPAFNSESFILETKNSIIKQSYGNWEWIIIDDGSFDSTGIMLDESAINDSRILIIHSINHGIDTARNIGIDCVNGKWFTFIDSDDLFPIDALESLVNEANDFDITIGGVSYFGSDNKTFLYDDRCLTDKKQIKNEFLSMFKQGVFWNACRSLYRTEKIHNKFVIGEKRLDLDSMFSANSLYKASSLRVIRKVVYYFRTGNKNSLSHTPHTYSPYWIGKTCNAYLECSDESEDVKSAVVAYYLHYFIRYILQIFRCKYSLNKEKEMVQLALNDSYFLNIKSTKYPLSKKDLHYYSVIMTKDFDLIKQTFKEII